MLNKKRAWVPWTGVAAIAILSLALIGYSQWLQHTEENRWGACIDDVTYLCHFEAPSKDYNLNRLRCLMRKEALLHPLCRSLLVDHGHID